MRFRTFTIAEVKAICRARRILDELEANKVTHHWEELYDAIGAALELDGNVERATSYLHQISLPCKHIESDPLSHAQALRAMRALLGRIEDSDVCLTCGSHGEARHAPKNGRHHPTKGFWTCNDCLYEQLHEVGKRDQVEAARRDKFNKLSDEEKEDMLPF